jgi:UDP-N-acetylmuramoylalanine--D-glutamate ligase
MSSGANLLRELKGQPVVVAGGGRSGTAASKLLAKLGARVTLVDDRPEVSSHDLSDPEVLQAKVIVLSPGIPRTHPAIAKALANSILVINELELAAAQLPDCRFVGVTGTNGKSTTTTILGCIAKTLDPRAFVGGNLGIPLCEAVYEGQKPGLAIVELSSFQIETISQLKLDAAVVTNLAPDHLDRYDSVTDYYKTKARIFGLLTPEGVAILNRDDPTSMEHLQPFAPERRFDFNVAQGEPGVHVAPSAIEVCQQTSISIELDSQVYLGVHNRENAAAAAACAVALGFDIDTIRLGLANYSGIAHRLEPLGTIGNVRWINDSKGTNVEATLRAIASFDHGIHLILGGLGKGASYGPLVEACKGPVKAVYAIGQDAPVLLEAFEQSGNITLAETLDNAVKMAQAAAAPGDVILLSPACASYDQYQNFMERGEHFRSLFHQAQKKATP